MSKMRGWGRTLSGERVGENTVRRGGGGVIILTWDTQINKAFHFQFKLILTVLKVKNFRLISFKLKQKNNKITLAIHRPIDLNLTR